MLSLRSSKCVLANMNYVSNISIQSQLINLSINVIVFKLAELRAMQICHEFKNPYFHYNFLKLKISAII